MSSSLEKQMQSYSSSREEVEHLGILKGSRELLNHLSLMTPDYNNGTLRRVSGALKTNQWRKKTFDQCKEQNTFHNLPQSPSRSERQRRMADGDG